MEGFHKVMKSLFLFSKKKRKENSKNLKIESYAVRMDSVGERNSESTRRFAVGYAAQNTKSSRYNRSFSDTLFSMEKGDEDEKKMTGSGQAADQNDLFTRYKTGGIRFINNVPPDKSTPVARDIQSVRQQFVLYLWRLFFGDESAKQMSKKFGIDDMSASAESFENASDSLNVIHLYGVEERYSCEVQQVSFRSNGSVTTQDGRSFEFKLDFEMSSRFEQYYASMSQDIISMCDPLVLNFAGDIADLSDQKFSFDLDCDGEAEEISLLKGSNGFLSLDKNGDGIINDGSELFGAVSGDGFKDLAAYDMDNNGWIDENDDIFDALKIWYRDCDGTDKLLDLRGANVGAIYLGNADTDFNLRSADTFNVNGAIRKAGIFLYENAMAGSIVHLDIAN